MSGALIQNVIGTQLPHVDHAEGVWVYDTDGRRYLDGCSGAMAVNLGHSHPRIVAVMREQARRVTFTHRGAFASRSLVGLAEKLTEATGFAGVWFVDSGSEAIEAAMQFALQFHRERGDAGRTRFLSHDRSYHGNTLGASSLSGHPRRAGFGALAHDFARLPSPYGEAPGGASTPASVAGMLQRAESVIAEQAEELAGVVFEPVGGATLGATSPPPGYLRGLRTLCDRYGVLLIADEVMTGLGRTGRMLAVEHAGVGADLIALGKGVASGYAPVAATLVNERIMSTIAAGTGRAPGGHTYAGNPFGAAVADAVFDVLIDERLVDRAQVAGDYLAGGLERLRDAHAVVTDARGAGLLRAIEFAPPAAGPAGSFAADVIAEAMARGLIVYPATGGYNDACLVAPPLITTDGELDDLLERLDAAVSAAASRR
ncbi:aminotransferase family protein [Microbacterium sp. RD1]|uniref:aminotransferase family protein n=1 Tax=Microbacterium sp. RD1 TaxID=3457313 RepID=UPI003FA59EFE